MNSYLHFRSRLSDNNPCFKREKKARIWTVNLRQSERDFCVTKDTKKKRNYQDIVCPEPSPSSRHNSQGKRPPTASLVVNLDRLGLSLC